MHSLNTVADLAIKNAEKVKSILLDKYYFNLKSTVRFNLGMAKVN